MSKPLAQSGDQSGPKFEATRLDGLYPILDGIAWLDNPTASELTQFSGLDGRTVGKILKNATHLQLIEKSGTGYILRTSYPYKGTEEEKASVIKEALLKLPILRNLRQFLSLGDDLDTSLRKAATLCRYSPFDASRFSPLLNWARSFDVLSAGQIAEDMVDVAQEQKEVRHRDDRKKVVAFLSHSSNDKPFIRQLASDLTAAGISVWLDEQRIHVGDSIPEKIDQGLAASDFFLLAVSKRSVESEWVKKELNNALVTEVQKRKTHILPLKLDDVDMPGVISDKKYANFSTSYKEGLSELKKALLEDHDG